MKPKVFFTNNIASHYTGPLLLTLFKSKLIDFRYSAGKNKNWDIKTVDFNQPKFEKHSSKIYNIDNVWVNKKYLIWQKGVLRRVLFKMHEKPELIILLGEFTILSNWLLAIIFRAMGITVAFRGHGLYGNEGALKLFIRKTFYRLSNLHLVYERHSKKLLVKHGFKEDNIHVIFNSLDYDYHKSLRSKFENYDKEAIFSFFTDSSKPTLIFIGRLTKIKRLHMLLDVVEKINASPDQEVNLLVIGDGVERQNLENQAKENLKEGTYHFFGSCYDEDEIGKLLSKSDLCVSPGNVGLTCIHSLSMGTPVCTHGNFFNQMPEVEAIENGMTGIFFEENNSNDLYLKITDWLNKYPSKSKETIAHCYQIIDLYYNPYFQEKVLLAAATKTKPLV